MFRCPNCNEQMPLGPYLAHARACGGAGTGTDNKDAVNTSNEEPAADHDSTFSDSSTGNQQSAATTVPATEPARFKCPVCPQSFTMADLAVHMQICSLPQVAQSNTNGESDKRSSNGNNDEEQRKRPRYDEGLRLEQRPTAAAMAPNTSYIAAFLSNREAHQQQHIPGAFPQPIGVGLVSLQPTTQPILNEPTAASSPITFRGNQFNASLRHESPAGRVSTPLSQQSQHVGSPSGAAAYQPQLANRSFTSMPSQQTPMLAQQTPQQRRMKEELVENCAGGAGVGGVGGHAELVEAIFQRLAPTFRQIENRIRQVQTDIGDVRQRVELFEASMMMKLGKIESAINRLKDDGPKND